MNNLDLITRALRRIGILGAGEIAQGDELSDAFDTLKGIYHRFVSDGAFGVITEVSVDGTYDALPNQRITATFADISFPDAAPDCSVICIVDPLTNQVDEYIFDGHRKKWQSINDLTLTDVAPLASRDSIGLSCYLAIELCDDYHQQPSELTVRNAARFQSTIINNWSVEREPTKGIYF